MFSWLRRDRAANRGSDDAARRAAATASGTSSAETAPRGILTLAAAARLEFEIFDALSRASACFDDPDLREEVGACAGLALAKHQAMRHELARRERDRVSTPSSPPHTGATLTGLVAGHEAWETLSAAYLVGGMFEDFVVRTTDRLPSEVGPRLAQLAASDGGADRLSEVLRTAITVDPVLSDRLSLWGRRLVGDTLLLVRAVAVADGEDAPGSALRLSPVFTDLIGAHTRRMDGLGLTA